MSPATLYWYWDMEKVELNQNIPQLSVTQYYFTVFHKKYQDFQVFNYLSLKINIF